MKRENDWKLPAEGDTDGSDFSQSEATTSSFSWQAEDWLILGLFSEGYQRNFY
jgi:hypothetical protein